MYLISVFQGTCSFFHIMITSEQHKSEEFSVCYLISTLFSELFVREKAHGKEKTGICSREACKSVLWKCCIQAHSPQVVYRAMMYFSSQHVAERPGWCGVTHLVPWQLQVRSSSLKRSSLLYDLKLFFLRTIASVFRKKGKEATSRYALTEITIDSHSVPKIHDSVLKLSENLLKTQLRRCLSRNSYSFGLGGVWALVTLEIFPGDSNIRQNWDPLALYPHSLW